MKYLFALAATCIAFATGAPQNSIVALNAPVNILTAPLPSGTGSFASLLTFPQQPAEDSVGQFLDRLFDEGDTAVVADPAITSKRAVPKSTYSQSYGLHTSKWENATDGKTVSYNISVDFSKCGHGVKLTDDVGVYTFTNGTTSNTTTLRDLVMDVWSLRHRREHKAINLKYNNHICTNADAALAEANQALTDYLICKPTTDVTPTQDLVHNELRRLLYNPYSYWTSVIGNFGVGAAAGGGIAAVMDHFFQGNVSAQNVVQTATVVGAAGVIGGIWARCHDAGHLDGTQRVAQNAQQAGQAVGQVVGQNLAQLVPGGREAVVQNVFMGVARRAIARVVRSRVEEAVSQAASSIPGSPGGSVPGSGQGTPMSAADQQCLTEDVAAQAATEIGNMVAPELELSSISEIEVAEASNGPRGDCNV